MNKLVITSLVAAALPAAASAQTTLAGWTFSQFLDDGIPSVNAVTFETTDFVVATYRGGFDPDSNLVDGVIVGSNGGTGYVDPSFGTWSFSNFSANGTDVTGYWNPGGFNTVNSTTLDGKQMHLSDTNGNGLSFGVQNTLWTISVADTTGFTNVDGDNNDVTFAARSTGGAVVEWLYNGSVFAITNVTAGSAFNTYGFDFIGDGAGFYSTGVITGRLASGTATFDNYQVNGTAIPEPSSFAALAGLVGLGFAASRRRRA